MDSVNPMSSAREDPGTPTAFGAANQRTTLWAVSFDHVLDDPSGLYAFNQFLEKEFSAENIHFWIACQRLRLMTDAVKIRDEVRRIYDHYLSGAAEEAVNIDNTARSEAMAQVAEASVNSFTHAEHQIYKLMRDDSYQRFLRSDIFGKFMKKEASGKDLPELDLKSGRIKKSSHNFFNWNSSSFKNKSGHQKLSLGMRPKSLNFETNSVSTPSSKSASLSFSHRDLSPSHYERASHQSVSTTIHSLPSSSCSQGDTRDRFHSSCTSDPLSPSNATVLSRFNTSPYKSVGSSDTYPTPPPVVTSRKVLASRKPPFGSMSYEFYSFDTKSQPPNSRYPNVSKSGKSGLEEAEDDLLSSIISASQHVPSLNRKRDLGDGDFDSPRDLFRFLSQPNLNSPAFIDEENTNVSSKLSTCYLSPSLGDVYTSSERLGGNGEQVIRKVKKRGHRLHPPPPPPVGAKSRPLIPLPESSAGRTPLKRITTNFDKCSSILV